MESKRRGFSSELIQPGFPRKISLVSAGILAVFAVATIIAGVSDQDVYNNPRQDSFFLVPSQNSGGKGDPPVLTITIATSSTPGAPGQGMIRRSPNVSSG